MCNEFGTSDAHFTNIAETLRDLELSRRPPNPTELFFLFQTKKRPIEIYDIKANIWESGADLFNWLLNERGFVFVKDQLFVLGKDKQRKTSLRLRRLNVRSGEVKELKSLPLCGTYMSIAHMNNEIYVTGGLAQRSVLNTVLK